MGDRGSGYGERWGKGNELEERWLELGGIWRVVWRSSALEISWFMKAILTGITSNRGYGVSLATSCSQARLPVVRSRCIPLQW